MGDSAFVSEHDEVNVGFVDVPDVDKSVFDVDFETIE